MKIIFVTFYGNGYRIAVLWERGPVRGLAPPEKKLCDTSQTTALPM